MRLNVVKTIAFKELLETLRDKRTLLAMVGVPVLLYPLLLIAGTQALLLQQGKVAAKDSRVWLMIDDAASDANASANPNAASGADTQALADVRQWLSGLEKVDLLTESELDEANQSEADALAKGQAEIQPVQAESKSAPASTNNTNAEDNATVALSPRLNQAIANDRLDAVVHVSVDHEQPDGQNTWQITVLFDSTQPESVKAKQRLQDGLASVADERLKDRLVAMNLPESFVKPLAVEGQDVAPPKKKAGSVLGSALPLMMIVMLGVGAFYPAVDLTAGEKERGTFETLLSTPTSRSEMVAGKFLTVLGLSIFTGLLNLGSMAATIGIQLSMMGDGGSGDGASGGPGFLGGLSLSFGDVAMMGLIVLPLALMIASIMMAVALLAKDFKEASNYLSPFFMAIVLPAAVVTLPGSELTGLWQFAPIANVSLLFKALLMETATPTQGFLVFMSTLAYAALALQVAVWMFQREGVILSEEKGVPLTLKRSQFDPRTLPTPGFAMTVFAVCLLLFFHVGSYLQHRDLVWGLIATQWGLLAGVAVLLVWFVQTNVKETFSFKAPPLAAWLAVLLLMPGALVWIQQISHWMSAWFPDSNMDQQLAPVLGSTPVWLLVFAFAITPAVCEELLFRGAVFGGFRSKMPAWAAVVLSGLLFGVFHMSLERVPPTAMLGMLIGLICLRTGSIFPGMLYHALHNGTLVLLATPSGQARLPQSVLDYLGSEQVTQHGFGWPVLAGGAVCFGLGFALLWTVGSKNNRQPGTGQLPVASD